jgi:hypothetical protein
MTDKKKNQILLLIINGLKTILTIFTSTFFTSYIIHLNPDNIMGAGCLNIALFYISQYFFYIVIYYLISKYLSRLNRVRSFQAGIIVNGLLLAIVILFKENISKWIVLAGLLIGCSDAFYNANYLVFKNDTVKYTNINNFNIITSILTNTINIVIPIVLGFLIDLSSYSYISTYIIIIVVVQLILSSFLKSITEVHHFRPKEFFKIARDKNTWSKIKYTYYNAICAGFKNTFKALIVILTIYAFNTNLSLGVLTSVFSIITTILLVIYRKMETLPKLHRLPIFMIIGILPLIFAIIFVLIESHWSLVALNLTLTIAIQFSEYTGNCERDTIIKNLKLKDYIPEHQYFVEFFMCIFRIFAYLLFIIVELLASSIAFKIFLIAMLLTNPIKFFIVYKQYCIRKELESAFHDDKNPDAHPANNTN